LTSGEFVFNLLVKYYMTPDRLSTTFAALADPTRRAILARLASGETSVLELAKPFAISLPAVSRHLKVLEHAGLIERGREAQWRPCRLQANPLKGVADWVEFYRRHWEESFDKLDRYLKELQRNNRAEDIQRKEKRDGRK
jgi:DNA-binding transcriptional ArsR family regulator